MVYLDYNSTTPVDPLVLDAMMPILKEHFGNPSSNNHDTGRTASDLVEKARQSIASIIGMKPTDVIFTSGATEANNLVFWGLSLSKKEPLKILCGATEHKSVLEPCKFLSEQGASVTKIPVSADGVPDLEQLEHLLSENDVDIVSVMAANSETGVINPIKKITEIVHNHNALIHCDATQAIGKIPFDAGDIDMVTFSSHKIYGPKGCGALVATRDVRRQIQGIIHGGGQENNLRSGTLNVPGIVGFGKACDLAQSRILPDMHMQALRDNFEKSMMKTITDITINGLNADRLANTSNIRIMDALADAIIVNAPEIEISTGSACTSSTMEPSHVLVAMGLDTDAANESIRVSLGLNTTQNDINMAVKSIAKAVKYVRSKQVQITESMT